MNVRCIIGHQWTGCRCQRCGKPRDTEHAWVQGNCRLVCRRCGLPGGWCHEWEGCRCKVCRETRHDWQGDRCARCGKNRPVPICLPPVYHTRDVSATGWTAH